MWSLYEKRRSGKEKKLDPMEFSNGKTQEDIVREVLEAINEGYKMIFINGMCGTGKSAIALNIIKELGRGSVVVPIKSLQSQYERDYMTRKYLLKENGEKIKIGLITGRRNHQCKYFKENFNEFAKKLDVVGGSYKKKTTEINTSLDKFENPFEKANSISAIVKETKNSGRKTRGETDETADNPLLPCKIEIKEENKQQIKKYLKKNPKIEATDFKTLRYVRRMSVAPICPYWSPIVAENIELGLEDAEKIPYRSVSGKNCVIYKRKSGCPYFEQFLSYAEKDVLIFNSMKYRLESLMNRKPATDVEIIDECDEFLDSFSNYKKLNINRLNFALGSLFSYEEKANKTISTLMNLTKSLITDPKIQKHIEKKEIIQIKKTKIYEIIKYFLDTNFMKGVEADEENYAYHGEEVARSFSGFFDETYISFHKEGINDKDLVVRIVTTNLEKKFKTELVEKNKVIVMMSGTLHNKKVLKDVFGLENFKTIDAETKMPGSITKKRTGMEFNCRYDNFRNGNVTREHYLKVLIKCIDEAPRPTLIQVNSFRDLPTEKEILQYDLDINMMTKENLKRVQNRDILGEEVKRFKEGKTDILYSTKANRGISFPGTSCNSIVITKYPFPDISSLFWRIFKLTHPKHYSAFYTDKAQREFLQKIYRGLRKKNDHITLLSPDIRVFYAL